MNLLARLKERVSGLFLIEQSENVFWGPDGDGYFHLHGAGVYTAAGVRRAIDHLGSERRDRSISAAELAETYLKGGWGEHLQAIVDDQAREHRVLLRRLKVILEGESSKSVAVGMALQELAEALGSEWEDDE